LPPVLKLGKEARCRCGAVVDDSTPITTMDCIVYDHCGATRTSLEVRRCPRCPSKSRMSAGPDLGELGLFNYNNSTIISHALLNKYDAMVSASETTFHAFCLIMAREYEMYGSPLEFMGEDRFRTCWFSFLQLQTCGDAFTCTVCGDAPRVVIVDGVTVGFQKRKQTSTLRPPTHACATSACHSNVRVPKK
ncbi:hypothetical protein EXIGLDRAFT_589612, partial [Exidia glandulosa HHB12029]